jgi:hypothetical protein
MAEESVSFIPYSLYNLINISLKKISLITLNDWSQDRLGEFEIQSVSTLSEYDPLLSLADAFPEMILSQVKRKVGLLANQTRMSIPPRPHWAEINPETISLLPDHLRRLHDQTWQVQYKIFIFYVFLQVEVLF